MKFLLGLEHRFHAVIDGAYAGLESNSENLTMDTLAQLFQDDATNILSGLSLSDHERLLAMIRELLYRSDLKGVFEAVQHIANLYLVSSNFSSTATSSFLPKSRLRRDRSNSVNTQNRKPLLTLFAPQSNDNDRLYFYVLLLACADCCLKWKAWNAVYQHAKTVMSDLYAQSDQERKALGLDSLANLMRDAERDIPLMEVKFIDSIAAPCLELFKILLGLLNAGGHEEATDILYRLLENRRKWEEKMPAYEDHGSLESIRAREIRS
jgi:hypothetical protein